MHDPNLVLPQLLVERAAKYPDHVFLEEVGGTSWGYAEFDEQIRTWAGAYRQVGVQPFDTVVTMMPASAKAACAWLGLARLRAIEVPCNTAYRGRLLDYLLANAAAKVLVIHQRYVDRLSDIADGLSGLETIVIIGGDPDRVIGGARAIGEDEFFAGIAPIDDPITSQPWDTCALLYTSGTTGPSKGVRFPWGQLYGQATGAMPIDDLTEDDAWYMPYPMHHVTGKTPFYTMALANGRIVIRDGFQTQAFWADIDRYHITTTAFLGPMAQFLWNQQPCDDDATHPLKNVFLVPLVPFLDGFKERFDVRVATAYGSVENSVPIHNTNWTTSSATWRSCGRLREGYPGYEVRIVDEHDIEVPAGESGELIIRTAEPWTMNQGYFGMPEKTVEAWRNGWFHTGDAFTVDGDGNYYFVDRARDCIRRRGENISSFELETEVNAHPSIVECAAVGVPSEFGEDEVKVVVVVKEGDLFEPADLIEFLSSRIPRFMVPRYVEVVGELPKTEATLRVKKFELRQNMLNEATWDREATRSA